MNDKEYMALAIKLANATKGQTSPNPNVGAVIVKNNQIVGIGNHLFAGLEHAEIYAINTAGIKAQGATLYVTLEPCAHFGKTPPCTAAVISAGISRVVIATLDLNPKVRGRGVEQLQVAGIIVEVGLLESEAQQLNQEFFHAIQNKTPYITIKAGVSLDCKLATKTGESKWITNSEARLDAHYYRHTHDAILVGVGSVIADNPSLTTRIPGGGKNPIRIILDTNLRTPLNSNVVIDKQSPTWIITGSRVSTKQIALYSVFPQVKIIQMPKHTIEIKDLLPELFKLNIISILVEGGNTVHTSFLDGGFINRLVVYMSPVLIGGKDAPTLFAGTGFEYLVQSLALKFEEVEHIGSNLKIVATIDKE